MNDYYPAGKSATSFDTEDVSRETLTDIDVMCRVERCERFETSFDVRANVATIGRHEVAYWTCPGCNVTQEYYEEVSE